MKAAIGTKKYISNKRLCAISFATMCMLLLLTFIGNAYAHKPASGNKQSKPRAVPIEILAVSASSHHENESQPLNNMIDGNLNTNWILTHFPQELILDLGLPQMISSTRIAFDGHPQRRHKENYRYTISVSLDSINWVKVKKNQKYDAALWTKTSFNPLNARYIKISTTTIGHKHKAAIHDIEVYGQKSSVSKQDNQSNRKITLSWLPSDGEILGYLVYYGASTNSASAQISDISANTPEFNSQPLSIQYDSWLDLNMSPGENVCFRVKAYSGLGLSKSSKAVCRGI